MKRFLLGTLPFALMTTLPANAGEWRVGPAISAATGLDDVSDIYEQNYNNTHRFTQVETKFLIPVGLAVQGTYNWDSGARLDMGLGPVFWIRDIEEEDDDIDTGLEYTDVPVSITAGYTFIPSGSVSPYVRAGIAHHFASGDYVEGSDPGFLGAAGVEFMRKGFVSVALEVALDGSKVEFERFQRVGNLVRRSTEKVKTYETIIAVVVKF